MISPIHLSNTDLGAVVLTVGTVCFISMSFLETERKTGCLFRLPQI